MIKPVVMPEEASQDQLMLVVEVGKVRLALPPRLSKIVQLFNEGHHAKVNGQCHVVYDQDHVFGELGNSDGNHSNGTSIVLLNGDVEENSSPVRLTNGHHTPSPDLSEDGYPVTTTRERRDYRGLVKVHKSKRKLPELPTDPKMSIFNNIDRLGVLEAELDVKKLEVKIRRQRQKVAAEFRSLTPDQRRELVVESPYLQKQIQRAMKSRVVNRSSTISDISTESEDSTTPVSAQDSIAASPCSVTSSPCNMTSSFNRDTSFSSSISTVTCSTPKHSPPEPPDIMFDSTLDLDDSLGVVTSCNDLIGSQNIVRSARSPLPLPQTLEDEIVSICSSGPDNQFSTPTTTPTLQPSSSSSSSSSPSQETVIISTNPLPQVTTSDKLSSQNDMPAPPPSDISPDLQPQIGLADEPLISLDEEELPPYSEHDLTFVTPLPPSLHSSYSTEALEISHTPTHDQPKKVLSDSQVSVLSVHTPVSNHDDQVAQQPCARRAELCTPIHSVSLSASDSQLHKKKVGEQEESYERAQSVPYGIERNSASDVENILAKKFINQKKSYSSKSISDKLEEIQSKHSPRSFLNNSCSQDVSSYTLSYEDNLGDIGNLVDVNNLYDDVITSDVINNDVINSEAVETDAGCKVAVQLDFDSDDFVTHMNARNEKENILSNFVSLDTGLCSDPTGTKSRDVTLETESDRVKEERDLRLLKELEDENKTNDIVDRLSSLVLNDIISSYTETFTPPPPPYVSTKVDMRVAHSTDDVRDIADQAVDYFASCVKCGNPIDLNREPDSIPDYADPVSYRAFCKLLTCQAHELFMQAASHFDLLGSPVKPPPWIRDQIKPPQPPWLLKHRRTKPHTLESIKPMICEEVTAVTNTQFYSIEAILSKEVVQGDALWQDFNKDEVAMKFRLADILLVNLLQDTVNSFKSVASKQNKQTSSPNQTLFDKTDFHVPTPRQRFSRQRTLSF